MASYDPPHPRTVVAWILGLAAAAAALSLLVRFFIGQLSGGPAWPDAAESLAEQTARLERLITQPLDRHHEILVGIRLAEIYRLNQHAPAKADALLARLRAKHPDAPELHLAGSG